MPSSLKSDFQCVIYNSHQTNCSNNLNFLFVFYFFKKIFRLTVDPASDIMAKTIISVCAYVGKLLYLVGNTLLLAFT